MILSLFESETVGKKLEIVPKKYPSGNGSCTLFVPSGDEM